MTATNETRSGTEGLLENILSTVESIDKNVEEILDQLSDHLAGVRYAEWGDDRYPGHDAYD